jgi:hypothetical protein
MLFNIKLREGRLRVRRMTGREGGGEWNRQFQGWWIRRGRSSGRKGGE